MFKFVKYSIDSELQLHFSNLKLEKFIDEINNLLEDIDELREDFSLKKRDLDRDTREYLGLYQSYTKFLTMMPQQNYDEFERERRVKNEIMDKYRRNFMNQIIAVDLAHITLNDAKNRLSEVRKKINILTNSF